MHSKLLDGVPLGPVEQIGIVVTDIAQACDAYGRTFTGDDWLRYTYDAAFVPEMTLRGKPAAYSMHIAMAGANPQIELIQPLAGPSLYTEHLEEYGPGLHHLGVFVQRLETAITRMEKAGFPVLQTGRGHGLNGDGGFAYFDTRAATGTIFEAIERPRVRRPPLASFPVANAR